MVRRASLWILAAILAAVFGLGVAPSASALEGLDGKLQIHGFGQTVLRTVSNNFTDDFDLAQWQFVFNVETELDIAPDGWGPFTALSAYARVEVRYDCVWRRACGIGSSADAYGDRVHKLPHWLTNARDSKWTGTTFGDPTATKYHRSGRPLKMRDHPLFDLLFGTGPDQIEGTADDPGPLVLGPLAEYKFMTERQRGPLDGINNGRLMGPIQPKSTVNPIGALRFVPNFLSPIESNPVTGMPFTSAPIPFRPFPKVSAKTAENYPGGYPKTEASGLYFPSWGLQSQISKHGDLKPLDVNFRQAELEWNRGASQQDEKELKELYFDMEFFDGRLWVRMGKQTIVWGKTEIFRSQDQFNPQDLSLATLPGLEESRVGLWSVRAVWSFYDVAFLEDVRLEVAAVLDDFQSADLGDCGEPYAPLPSCDIQTGMFVHGILGFGVAGFKRPPAWWNDTRGLEAGIRLEARWGRVSFAITDFYGYSDFPNSDVLFKYERNVDPRTGRPRMAGSRLGCDPENLFDGETRGCLGDPPGTRYGFNLGFDPFAGQAGDGRIPNARSRFLQKDNNQQIIEKHYANQTFFHTACASTVGFTDLIPALVQECGFGIFGSQAFIAADPPAIPFDVQVSHAISAILSGSNFVWDLAIGVLLGPGAQNQIPVVPLNARDPRTGEGAVTTSLVLTLGTGLARSLTPEQQALLGCGAFFGTSCDDHGLDLLNAEASALLQSFPGIEGTSMFGFTTLAGHQPGTLGFDGGPVCTRYERGKTFILPGCRGPEDPNYDPAVDGIPIVDAGRFADFAAMPPAFPGFNFLSRCPALAPGDRLIHPLTCQPFRSEMSAMSFNFLLLTVIFSTPDDNGVIDADEFDTNDPWRTDGCSLAAPQFCSATRSLMSAAGVGRNTLKAGGSHRFGRRDFLWHGGQELALTYNKRNVLGFSMDFSEDWSKTNWGVEFTWLESEPFTDRDSLNGITDVDVYNLTISIDRPTFVNFLNANRTLIFNTQWFIRYTPQVDDEFSTNGPWNVLGTFTIITGYFQDRLFAVLTLVYDIGSTSGAGLPSLTYRFNDRFSASFGMAFFFGRQQFRDMHLMPTSLANRKGRHAYKDFVENGLAVVRQRDEFFFRLRMTF